MASTSYIRKKRENASKRGKYGNEVKARLRMERAESIRVVGSMRTDGVFGEHLIELLYCGDEYRVWMVRSGNQERLAELRKSYQSGYGTNIVDTPAINAVVSKEITGGLL